MTKYYKAFNRDMTCRDFQYEEGGIYEISEPPELCERGFHFCNDLVLTLGYYPINNDICENFYAEVEPLGEIVWEEPTKHKGCTNKLKIVRVIPDEEVKNMVDARNNSGNSNSGNSNSGNRNSGNSNSGDWNACNCSTGAFNTKQEETIQVFNKPCKRKDWEEAYKPNFLYFDIDQLIGYKASFKRSWNDADPDDRIRLKELPNFDANVFYEISGIDLRENAKGDSDERIQIK